MLYYAVPCCAVLIYAELLYTAILSPALLCQLATNQADFRDIRSVQYVLCNSGMHSQLCHVVPIVKQTLKTRRSTGAQPGLQNL